MQIGPIALLSGVQLMFRSCCLIQNCYKLYQKERILILN
jgi:hypothetical protein